jgi:hypothetical protein
MEQHGQVCHVGLLVAPPAQRTPFTGPPPVPPTDPLYLSHPGLPKSTSRRALWWGISGTALSVVGFIAMLLFEQYNAGLAELRGDLKHFNEVSAEFVKRDHMRRLLERLREGFKDLQAAKAVSARLDRELQASENDRKELAHELQRLRERLASVEGRQAATPVIFPGNSPPAPGIGPAPGLAPGSGSAQ